MKNLSLTILALAAFGCGAKSPYDVSSSQIESRRSLPVGGGKPDLAHLPPGAVKKETKFKKGDKLPDGSIATHDGKLVTVTADASLSLPTH